MLRVSDAGTDSCSLGRHCEAIARRAEGAAYRRAHPRVSETSGTTALTSSATGIPWREPAERSTLFELFADAMDRLERINPPTD